MLGNECGKIGYLFDALILGDVTGTRVVLDQDLASFFNVETRVLNQSGKRHLEWFPKGWAFQLTKAQLDDLKSQDVISSDQWAGRRSPPWVFTEHGVVMVATLLNSARAVEDSQFIVEACDRARRGRCSCRRGRNRIGQFLRSRSWGWRKRALLPEFPCPDSRLSQADFRIGAYTDPDCLAVQLSHC